MKTKNGMNGKEKKTIEMTGRNSKKKSIQHASDTDFHEKTERFSLILLDKYRKDGMTTQMHFLNMLTIDFNRNLKNSTLNQKSLKSLLNRFNSYMSQYLVFGEELDDINSTLPLIYEDISFENAIGKYPVTNIDGVPRFSFDEPNTLKDLTELIIAGALLNFIYTSTDIRKIEANMPELEGLCDYLKKLAPDAYYAYCKLSKEVGFDAPLNIQYYRQILNKLIINLHFSMN